MLLWNQSIELSQVFMGDILNIALTMMLKEVFDPGFDILLDLFKLCFGMSGFLKMFILSDTLDVIQFERLEVYMVWVLNS
jgi:hypothetical protein